ncbi:lysoplasmalogenase family protein [Pseudonocardia sp. CA-107938]|uniref:lysoplasmalogenase family protein n=1 Tax=Pseudonocardia sp. CA-107938 TaxID=3240021 RepID=UPI003D8ECAD1
MTISRRSRWAVYGLTALADTVAAAAGARRVRRLTKPALMPLLATAAGPRAPRAALAGAWAGDVALLGTGDAALAGGIGGFAAAHLAYLRDVRALRPSIPVAGERAVAAAFAATAVAATAAIAPRLTDRPVLRGPVAAYAALVTSMGYAAVVTGLRRRDARGRLLAVGGGLFVVSDGLVAMSLFGGPRPAGRTAAVEAGVMATYTAAQALLAAAIAAD